MNAKRSVATRSPNVTHTSARVAFFRPFVAFSVDIMVCACILARAARNSPLLSALADIVFISFSRWSGIGSASDIAFFCDSFLREPRNILLSPTIARIRGRRFACVTHSSFAHSCRSCGATKCTWTNCWLG